jgi:hypothetical protein
LGQNRLKNEDIRRSLDIELISVDQSGDTTDELAIACQDRGATADWSSQLWLKLLKCERAHYPVSAN